MPDTTNPPKRSHPCKGMTKAAYRAYRKKHVTLWQASGLSKSDYATQIGVSKDAVRDWIRGFGVVPPLKTAHPNHTNTASPKQAPPSATLVPVRISPANQIKGLKLIHPDGIVLEWSEPPPAAWLAELLRGMA